VNGVVFDKALNYVKWIESFFSAFFACSFVAGYRYAILYLDGCGWVESYERVLRQFFWSFN
jgi:hypothetical protein